MASAAWVRRAALLSLALAVSALLVTPINSTPAAADPGPDLAPAGALAATEVQSVFVHVPEPLPQTGRLVALVALHGMGGNGEDFSRDFISVADANGWLVVAPTIAYGDWTDPNQVANEDPRLISWLSAYLDQLVTSSGLPLSPRVLLLGHSRGAQLALRFAEFQPERVRAVAAVSAGTYTLPLATDAANQPLPFPFGVADLPMRDGGRRFDAIGFRRVPTWVGVGADDANPADVPRAWDAYLGTTRVQRARTFVAALRRMGATAQLTVFAGDSHAFTPDMEQAASANLTSPFVDPP